MSSSQDITKKPAATSESFISEPQPENTACARRACDDDIIDMISHHNERWQRIDSEEEPEGMNPHTWTK